jgi:hypothetical protein
LRHFSGQDFRSLVYSSQQFVPPVNIFRLIGEEMELGECEKLSPIPLRGGVGLFFASGRPYQLEDQNSSRGAGSSAARGSIEEAGDKKNFSLRIGHQVCYFPDLDHLFSHTAIPGKERKRWAGKGTAQGLSLS